MSTHERAPIAPSSAERPLLARLAAILSRASTMALYLAAFALVAMTAIVAWQVFCRYVLNWSNSWTEISAVLLMSWFIFLGAAVGVRENYHLGFDVLLYVLPDGSKKWLRTLSDVLVSAFSLGMIIYGLQLVELGWRARMPALGIPEGVKYLPLVAGGLLILLFSIERVVSRFAGLNVDKDLHDAEVTSLDPVKEL
ncbi:TRAP transporter small permease subunit [Mesorhizobium sp. NBSH29]|uniref:TRAP transporter small permease n=1 Tax=Mesorhizobium sp. NBSH29 TaxID=2654249 RepID=UPI0018967A98|nr:TRAP transporter small permease [Mesorhizobium sp. NBSH29]QPC86929.1 TRAP transporter small permease subunit [Mesorhizobium sp. NBSH29]